MRAACPWRHGCECNGAVTMGINRYFHPNIMFSYVYRPGTDVGAHRIGHPMSTVTLAPRDAVALRTESHAAERALASAIGTLDTNTNNTGVVVRADLRFVIVYASTATHALESRADGRGQYWHRINRDVYPSAADIPATYRKLGAIARAVEAAEAFTLAALDTRYRADLALTASNEYRGDDVRAQALDLLAQPSPFAA